MSHKKVDMEFLLRVLYLTADISYSNCIWWRTDGEHSPVSIFINCNDKFEEGMGDCEELTPDNIYLFEEAITEIREIGGDDKYAPLLFCAKLRRARPRDEVYPRDKNMWTLFDRLGPAREKTGNRPEAIDSINEIVEAENEKSLKSKLIEYWNKFIEFIKALLKKMRRPKDGGSGD